MECSCGGVISTTGESLTSEEALSKYPKRSKHIPKGYSVLYVRTGECPGCGVFAFTVNPVKEAAKKSIMRFFKQRQ
jgi:hypothetical protein